MKYSIMEFSAFHYCKLSNFRGARKMFRYSDFALHFYNNNWHILLAIIITTAILLNFPQQSLAHHVNEGATPDSLWRTFLSGIGHPIINSIHAGFLILSSLTSIGIRKGALIPLVFVTATLVGTITQFAGYTLPASEIGIALSILIIGVILVYKLDWLYESSINQRSFIITLIGLATLAGIFHGSAYGESIIDSEGAKVLSYLGGIITIQFATTLVVFKIGKLIYKHTLGTALIRYTGFFAVAIGGTFVGAKF